MALRNRQEVGKRISNDYLSSKISSSTLDIVLDERSTSNSIDEDSSDQARQSEAGTTNHEHSSGQDKKLIPLRDPKSHRLIEKRRRDRMNTYLNELLELIPHECNQGQRRIEKTEIIEMAIKHIRHLLSTIETKSKRIDSDMDGYRTGYRNALADIYEFLDGYSDSEQLLTDITEYFKVKEIDLKTLTDMPDKKRPKYVTLSDRRNKFTSSKEQTRDSSALDTDDDRLCVISEVIEYKHNDLQLSTDDKQTSNQQSDSNMKVPIFVLHPSGTHYIPMCIDASVVSHAFEKNSSLSQSSSTTTDQVQCHPVSIPVNFNPITTTHCDSHELDIQNINVIGTRHQTSVRPN